MIPRCIKPLGLSTYYAISYFTILCYSILHYICATAFCTIAVAVDLFLEYLLHLLQ